MTVLLLLFQASSSQKTAVAAEWPPLPSPDTRWPAARRGCLLRVPDPAWPADCWCVLPVCVWLRLSRCVLFVSGSRSGDLCLAKARLHKAFSVFCVSPCLSSCLLCVCVSLVSRYPVPLQVPVQVGRKHCLCLEFRLPKFKRCDFCRSGKNYTA